MKRIFLLLILIFLAVDLSAATEKIKTVRSVRGEYAVVLQISNITGREACEFAREDARRKALEKVCGSHVNIWDQIENSSAGEVYNSLSIRQIDGEIVSFEIIEEGNYPSQVRPSETIFYCVANVKVKKGLSPDPNFIADVSGLKSVYFNGETLDFSIFPYQDCYLNIFLFENSDTGYQIYPNEYDSSVGLPAETLLNICDSPYYEFRMQKSSDAKVETNRLVFVFTKTRRTFPSRSTSRAEIETWMAKIPNDEKYLHFAVFEIRDN